MSEAEKGPHSDVLQQFLHSPWWESPELEATLLSPDCVVEYPFAPPGMPKQFPTTKRALLAEWLKRTTRKWSRDQIVHYPTKGGSREWVESHTSAEVQWGPHAVFRPFSCEQIELFEFSNGKISLIRSWCDPMAFYLGAGINLPVFNYSGVYPSVEDTPARAATNSPHPGKGEAEKVRHPSIPCPVAVADRSHEDC
jgi:ketosteroid isomerase-like protein